jgi:ribosome-binding protein aMBF1 (putative translation factor)
VLTAQTGLLKEKLVPVTQHELDRREAAKEKRKKEGLERTEKLREDLRLHVEQAREAERLQREEQARKANESV